MSIILIVVLYFIPGLYYVMSRCVLLRVHIESHRVKVAEREGGGGDRGAAMAFFCVRMSPRRTRRQSGGGTQKKRETGADGDRQEQSGRREQQLAATALSPIQRVPIILTREEKTKHTRRIEIGLYT